LHCQEGSESAAALTRWSKEGIKISESWVQNSKARRLDGPAYSIWTDDGTKSTEIWYKDMKLYRLDGPVYTYWNDDGSKTHDIPDSLRKSNSLVVAGKSASLSK